MWWLSSIRRAVRSLSACWRSVCFDVAVALVMLPAALAVCLPFALAIWLGDRHPPLYAGPRVGKDWKPYKQLKLRTMVWGADSAGIDATAADDARITPLGRLMRRAKIDELPQVINVLAGDMSLVGPRPNLMRECRMYSDLEKKILEARPGITDISSIVFVDEERILAGAKDADLAYHQLVRPWKSRLLPALSRKAVVAARHRAPADHRPQSAFASPGTAGPAERPAAPWSRRPAHAHRPSRRAARSSRAAGAFRRGARAGVRILLLNRAFYPDTVATSQYATDIAHDLKARGHDVTVLSGRRDYTMPQKLYPRFEVVDGISVYRVSSTNFGKNSLVARILDAVSYDLASLVRLVRLPRQDLVLSFTSPPLVGFYGALVARFWRARFVYWIMNLNHEMAIETGYLKRDGLLGRLLGWIHRFTLRSCDAVVVMDRWMKTRVLRDDPIDASRVSIIPLWPVHEPEDAVAEEAEAFRKAHGLDGKFVVMHSGNLSHIHPLDTVLDAAVRLKDDPSIAFVFVGHGRRETDIDAAHPRSWAHQHRPAAAPAA